MVARVLIHPLLSPQGSVFYFFLAAFFVFFLPKPILVCFEQRFPYLSHLLLLPLMYSLAEVLNLRASFGKWPAFRCTNVRKNWRA